jgi:hypothetical protein
MISLSPDDFRTLAGMSSHEGSRRQGVGSLSGAAPQHMMTHLQEQA